MRPLCRKRYLVTALYSLLMIASHPANATHDKVQQWTTLNLNKKINALWSFNFLTQSRLALSDERNDIYVFRPSIHYRFKGLTVGLGGDQLTQDGGNDEHRLWQQVSFGHKLERLSLNYRIRVEQRFIEDLKMVLRGRYMIKSSLPLSEPGWKLIASNEILINHNSRGRGPAPGFDQNRLFIGPAYSLNEHTTVTGGYMWRYLSRRDAENISDHTLSVSLGLSF